MAFGKKSVDLGDVIVGEKYKAAAKFDRLDPETISRLKDIRKSCGCLSANVVSGKNDLKVDIVYAPRSAGGRDSQLVQLVDQRDKVIGEIEVVAKPHLPIEFIPAAVTLTQGKPVEVQVKAWRGPLSQSVRSGRATLARWKSIDSKTGILTIEPRPQAPFGRIEDLVYLGNAALPVNQNRPSTIVASPTVVRGVISSPQTVRKKISLSGLSGESIIDARLDPPVKGLSISRAQGSAHWLLSGHNLPRGPIRSTVIIRFEAGRSFEIPVDMIQI